MKNFFATNPYHSTPLLPSNLQPQYLAYQHSDTITGLSQPHTYFRGAHPVWSTVSNDLLLFLPAYAPTVDNLVSRTSLLIQFCMKQGVRVYWQFSKGKGRQEKVRLSTIFSDARKLGWRLVENMASYLYIIREFFVVSQFANFMVVLRDFFVCSSIVSISIKKMKLQVKFSSSFHLEK